jgi:hypothetical protein
LLIPLACVELAEALVEAPRPRASKQSGRSLGVGSHGHGLSLLLKLDIAIAAILENVAIE